MHLTSLISNKSDWTTFNKPRETVDKAQGWRQQTSVLERRKRWPENFEWSGWTLYVTPNKVSQKKRNQVPKSRVDEKLFC